jgi:DNA topoisomerase-3
MDEHGIGTDATIAEHIEKIVNHGYVDKTMQAEEAGTAITDLYQKIDKVMISTAFRAWMEAGLREIINGKDVSTVYDQVLSEAIKVFESVKVHL